MALASAIVWECRSTGAATNGGGFKAGASGTDWSQQDSPQYSVTDGVTAGTTTITSATASFGTDVVGNLVYAAGGTGSITGAWYEIVSRTNATTIVVDRSTGLTAGTGVTLKIGGALSDARVALVNMVSGNTVWIKSGTYTIGTAIPTNSGLSGFTVEGYGSTRGDRGTRPVLQASAAIEIWKFNVQGTCIIRNLEFDGNSTGTSGLNSASFAGSGSQAVISYCRFRRFTAGGFRTSYGGHLYFCEFDANQYGAEQDGAGYLNTYFHGCYFHDNTSHGVRRLTVNAYGCVFDTNGGRGIYGWGPSQTLEHCVFYKNTSHGIDFEDSTGAIGLAFSCIFYGNGGWGASGWKYFRACAFGSNTSGAKTGHTESLNEVTLSANPFADGDNQDFSLNSTSGGGTACKAVGYPATFPPTAA